MYKIEPEHAHAISNFNFPVRDSLYTQCEGGVRKQKNSLNVKLEKNMKKCCPRVFKF